MINLNPLGKTLQNAARLRTIVGVFAKHGFHQVAEKIQLGRFIIERLNASTEVEKLSSAERARIAFEELGPTFVKLGQLLATRADLIPQDFVDQFEKLHDQVAPLPFETIENVLKEEFGSLLWQKFASIDPQPIGSASIAQVHKAVLSTGEEVVIKVQRPGLIQTINEDLGVLYMLAELLEKYIPETKNYAPVTLVGEFFKALELETNFVVEANNIRKFSINFAKFEGIKIPKVYLDLTTERVLVMEALQGVPLSSPDSSIVPGYDGTQLIQTGLRAYLKMVFVDGLFHGDLHAGNFFVMPGSQVGMIDFGVVGRLNAKTQGSIASMLIALSKEDYERFAYEYVDLAPFTDKVNIDVFAKELRELIAPWYGLTMKNVNLGKILMKSARIAAKHHLIMPSELMLYFKSIVCIEGIGRKIQKDFDFLTYSLEFASELVKHQFEPNRIMNDVTQVARESKNFLNTLPRQLNFLVRKLNSPEHMFKFELAGIEELRAGMISSFNLLFMGLLIAALLISGSMMASVPSEYLIAGHPAPSFLMFMMSGVLGLLSFIHYLRK